MIIIEKSNFIIAIYDIKIAIKNFNIENVIQIQRKKRYVCNTCEANFNTNNNKTKHFSIYTNNRF